MRLLQNGQLGDQDITELVTLLKDGDPDGTPPRTYPTVGMTQNESVLKLISIGPVEGIDALNPRSPLEFGDSDITVVFGHNGSGKSGFTRILSNACGKPHCVSLRGNVYTPGEGEQKCTLTYQIDDERKEVTWPANGEPIDELRHVDVFDTVAGSIYLDRENEATYTPPELTLFVDLVDACKRVEGHLSEEADRLVSRLTALPLRFAQCEATKEYQELKHDLAADRLTELTTWSEANETALKALQDRLKEKTPLAAARRRRAVQSQINSLRSALQKGLKAVGPKALDGLRRLIQEATAKRKAVTEGAAVLKDVSVLDGVSTETWRTLWTAARAFSTEEAYVDQDFPFTGDEARCALCHQTLDEEAKVRMTEFETFVQGQLEKDASAAEKKLKEALEWFPIPPNKEELETGCQAAELSEPVCESLVAAWEKLKEHLDILLTQDLPEEAPEINESIAGLPAVLEQLAGVAEQAAKDLEEDAKSEDRTKASVSLLELEAKKWVAEQAAGIRTEIERLVQLEKLKKWKRKTSTNGITRKAGDLSQQLVTDAYIGRFNDELRKLGASKVQVELVKTRSKQGRTQHQVLLKSPGIEGVNVSEILSEGERRIVALAAFLADVTGEAGSAPFVFDDPISSLDQVFEEAVIARLIELSQERQVLVFTHRLSFLGIMNDKAGDALNCIAIRREDWGTGEVGQVPIYGKNPKGALNTLKQERVRIAENMLNEHGSEIYYPLAKSICSDFRIIIERLIEIVFLADVIQRHRRQIKTLGGEVFKLTKITNEDCQLVHDMMTKYSCYEHSQTPEAPVEMPHPDELRTDIELMLTWHDEFKKR